MKILMVCSGNICRSPLAAGILSKKLHEKNIEVTVDSAGFEPYHLLEKADPITTEMALKKGVDITKHSVRLFTKNDFDEFDRIYVMDYCSYRDVIFHARSNHDRKKVDYFLNALLPGQNKNLPNPLNRGVAELEKTFQLMEKTCDRIAESLRK